MKRLGETEVAEAEIPEKIAKAADELIRLRADLTRLSNERPEFAAIRARASALIDKGDFDAARAALNDGREGGPARCARERPLSNGSSVSSLIEARVERLQLNYDDACAKFEGGRGGSGSRTTSGLCGGFLSAMSGGGFEAQ